MDSDLVHPAGVGKAQHDTSVGLGIVSQFLECCVAFLALGRHLAHADLVAHHLDRLGALYHLTVQVQGTVNK